MIEEKLISLVKVKLELVNMIIKELPESLQIKVNNGKNQVLHSLLDLIKEELDHPPNTQSEGNINKVQSISIDF